MCRLGKQPPVCTSQTQERRRPHTKGDMDPPTVRLLAARLVSHRQDTPGFADADATGSALHLGNVRAPVALQQHEKKRGRQKDLTILR